MPFPLRQMPRLLCLCAVVSLPAWGQERAASRAIDASRAMTGDAVASQDRVDRLDEQTRKMLEQFRTASWEAQQLAVYAEQLEGLVDAQAEEKASLVRQLDALDRTEQELLPLMLRSIDYLEKFIALDLPFLLEERQDRVAALKRLMGDPGATHPERFRRILEALQIEVDYGRTLGAERQEVNGRSVDVLRIGRVEMYSLSADGKQAARWDPAARQWRSLPHRHAAKIRYGLRMAREIVAPDLISLPVLLGDAP